ncbi:MAG: glucoamylase family protein, partial [Sphaerochaeta sp.]|nr:glucoamylase family protein [Sphaerochaeta sp.]
MHIGEFLIGKHRKAFVKEIGYRPKARAAIQEWVLDHGKGVYLGTVLPFALLLWALLAIFSHLPQLFLGEAAAYTNQSWNIAGELFGTPFITIIGVLLGLAMSIPAFTVATSLVNWIITVRIPPRILPKMDFKHRLPDKFSTMVVIPGMIGSFKDIDSLVFQIEKHYLRNPEPGFQFAILTDSYDADEEIVAEDAELIRYAQSRMAELNKKYAQIPVGVQSRSGEGELVTDRFFFLHRKRLWNPSEGKWMGWERKRGKIHEFNRLLRGDRKHSFITLTEELKRNPLHLNHIKYVITLDDDSILPIGAGKRLVGAMAHPLNQPVFAEDETVSSGYTILQPRMEIHPKSTTLSWFTRLFSGDTGLDMYTLAVSDSYMDLIGEGIYVGKGIYDVDAFERSIHDHIPENTVLSHDLLEGSMGRAGLVSDITMVEDYPPNYMAKMFRKHRWTRGDWQLLPWLFRSRHRSHGFNCIDHWKIFDNLRRSLLSPALVFIFIIGVLFLPGLAIQWSMILIFSLSVPLFTGLARSAVQIVQNEESSLDLRPVWDTFVRWVLSVSFLPYDAYITSDAILTTLYRLLISRKNLLQWTTAAQTARLFTILKRSNIAWVKMIITALGALVLAIAAPLIAFLTTGSVPTSLYVAGCILLLWIFAPLITYRINLPIVEDSEPLSKDDITLLRQVARRTWGFFERFVGPDDHWLPPDHFQETPDARIAHRTSPTNIGLLLTSMLAAYDFGYLGHLVLTTRLSMTMDSMAKMERYRGHFFNWYDTLTREALPPHYVSTVDSGNLAASLIVTSQACQSLPSDPFLRWELVQGYLDLLNNLSSVLSSIRSSAISKKIKTLGSVIAALKTDIEAVRSKPDQWYSIIIHIEEKVQSEITTQLLRLIDISPQAFDEEILTELGVIGSQFHQHRQTVSYGIAELLPWMPLLSEIPPQLQRREYEVLLAELQDTLPSVFALQDHQAVTDRAISSISALQNSIKDDPDMQTDLENSPGRWLDQVKNAVLVSQKNAQEILGRYSKLSALADTFVEEMQFGFLYDRQKRVFHIGFSRDTGVLDNNHYNLLASEARIASLVAIAKQEVPSSHWMYLGRPVTRVENITTLLSWSGTMFEYLLPSLFLRSHSGTLLADSTRGAVNHQIAYAKSKGVPWGISESGYYRFDAGKTYQYLAFGVPGLGFKRGLSNDLVIAPYASLIALAIRPRSVLSNLRTLIKLKMFGSYGMYESLDFTKSRLMMNQEAAIVKEYMAHHQGMIFMALTNYLYDDIMVDRMHRDPDR